MFDSIELIATEFPWFFPLTVFVIGACIGSFLNVCIHRIPRGESVVSPGSHCACGRPVLWHDNIPILSWFILRGRARCCGRKFSFRYPFVEALTAGIFLTCWLTRTPGVAFAGMVFAGMMIAASFIDLDTMEIPDRFSVGGAVAGVFLATIFPSLHGHAGNLFVVESARSLVDAMIGALIGSAIICWIAILAEVVLRREAMGQGDVKLLGAIGAFCGWKGAVFSVFGGAMLGCLAIGTLLLFGRKPGVAPADLPEGEETGLGGREVPFGPMLAAAGLLYFLWLHPWINAWFADVSELLTCMP